MTAQAPFSNESVWIADSGVSHHMVPSVTHLDSATPCTTTYCVSIGNMAGLPIEHIGHAHVSSASSTLQLPNVFYVP